jgi:hypothetical protein
MPGRSRLRAAPPAARLGSARRSAGSAIGAGGEPLRPSLDGVQIAAGTGQQPQQLGALEPDRHPLVVLVVVRGEGLLFGPRCDLRYERGYPLRGGGALGGKPCGRIGRLLCRRMGCASSRDGRRGTAASGGVELGLEVGDPVSRTTVSLSGRASRSEGKKSAIAACQRALTVMSAMAC